jgi:hypothetical protein
MSEAGCGSCTLCCTVMRVAMEPPKAEHSTCSQCTHLGCAIYDTRPDVCRGFQCLWLASQSLEAYRLPPDMRPDRAGVVIDINSAGSVIAHCEEVDSWRRDPMHRWLLGMASRGHLIFLETRRGAMLLAAADTTEDLVKIGVDPASNNRIYARASQLDAAVAALRGAEIAP